MSLPPFQVLLDLHGPAVHRFLAASVGSVDADDCYQEACIAALRAYPDLRHHDGLKSWLFTVAHNKAIDFHRARARRPVPVERLPEEQAPAPAAPPDGDDPVWSQVRELPEKQRAAVFLRSVGDLSYAEVAVALGCSQDAARRSVHEGLKRLRQEVPS